MDLPGLEDLVRQAVESSTELAQHVRGVRGPAGIILDSTSSFKLLENYRPRVLAGWIFGSRLYGTAQSGSDVDVFAVVCSDSFPAFVETFKMERILRIESSNLNIDVEINVQHEVWFRARLRRHMLMELFFVLTPPGFTLIAPPTPPIGEDNALERSILAPAALYFADDLDVRLPLRKPRFLRFLLHEAGHGLAKGRRRFAEGDHRTGLKNVVHGIRFVRLATQLVESTGKPIGECEIDWGCANDLVLRIEEVGQQTESLSWTSIEAEFRPLLSSGMRDFDRKSCAPVFRVVAGLDDPTRSSSELINGVTQAVVAHDASAVSRELRAELSISSAVDQTFLHIAADKAFPVNRFEHLMTCFWNGVLLDSASGVPLAYPGPRWLDGLNNQGRFPKNFRFADGEYLETVDGTIVTLYHDPSAERGWSLMTRFSRNAAEPARLGHAPLALFPEDLFQFHSAVIRDSFSIGYERPSMIADAVAYLDIPVSPVTADSVATGFWRVFDKVGMRTPVPSSGLSYTFVLSGEHWSSTYSRKFNCDDALALIAIVDLKSLRPISYQDLDRVAVELNWPTLPRRNFTASVVSRASVEVIAQQLHPLRHSGIMVLDADGNSVFFANRSFQMLRAIMRNNGPSWAEGPNIDKSILDVVRTPFSHFPVSDPRAVLADIASDFPVLVPFLDRSLLSIERLADRIIQEYERCRDLNDSSFATELKSLKFSDVLFALRNGEFTPERDFVLANLAVRPSVAVRRFLEAMREVSSTIDVASDRND